MADLSGDDGDSACGYPGDGRFRNSCFTDTAVCFRCWYLHGIGGDGLCIGLYCTFYPGCTTYFDKQCADGHPALAENTAAGCCSGGGCYLFGLGIVFIPAVAALVDSLILESIFVQYMSKEDREKEALRNHPEQYEYYNRKE